MTGLKLNYPEWGAFYSFSIRYLLTSPRYILNAFPTIFIHSFKMNIANVYL